MTAEDLYSKYQAEQVAARLLGQEPIHAILTVPPHVGETIRLEIKVAFEYIHENTMGLYGCNVVDFDYDDGYLWGEISVLKDFIDAFMTRRPHLSQRLQSEMRDLAKQWRRELLV